MAVLISQTVFNFTNRLLTNEGEEEDIERSLRLKMVDTSPRYRDHESSMSPSSGDATSRSEGSLISEEYRFK